MKPLQNYWDYSLIKSPLCTMFSYMIHQLHLISITGIFCQFTMLNVINTELTVLLDQCSATFFQLRHTLICQTHTSTLQNFSSQKGGTKLYMAINMYLHIKPYPTRMQPYENKTQHILNETIDDEPVCVCVCVTNSNYESYVIRCEGRSLTQILSTIISNRCSK
jgi:hypothetical protein